MPSKAAVGTYRYASASRLIPHLLPGISVVCFEVAASQQGPIYLGQICRIGEIMLNINTGYGGIRQRKNREIVIMVSSIHRLSKLRVLLVFHLAAEEGCRKLVCFIADN